MLNNGSAGAVLCCWKEARKDSATIPPPPFSKKKIKAKRKKVCTSPLEAELLNVTFSYEGELKCSPRGDEEKKKEEAAAAGMKWKSSSPPLRSPGNHFKPLPERGLCFWKETLNGAFYAWLSADTKMPGLLLHF